MSGIIDLNRHPNLPAIIRSKLLLPLGLAILVLLFPALSFPQTHSPYPVDIIAGPAPQAVVVDGRVRLIYELHLTNFAPWPIEVTAIDVLGNGAILLASYNREALNKRVVPTEKVLLSVEPTDSTGKSRTVGEGHAVVIFLDLVLEPDVPTPSELLHRFSFSVVGDDGAPIQKTVNGPVVALVQDPPPVLHAPLRGTWIAFNALAAYDHRRAFNPFDGRIRNAQRFAIDWVRLGPDGRLFHGDKNSNSNFYGYGSEVLAVADGRVSDLKDDLPENVGITERKSRAITLDNAVGNYVTLDLGHGRFALCAHLQPGSLRVKLGDSVKAGQVLALVGNSGNSDAPHLHFQLTDANSPLGSEGIPYELESFTQLGVLDGPDVLDTGKAWQPEPGEKPVSHHQEFPVDNSIVAFP